MKNTNRTKGHNAERDVAKTFREIGFDKCKTSREASRLHDNCKIDLCFIPFNVQVKAGFQRGLNPTNEFKDMEEAIKQNFPERYPEYDYPKVLIHKKQVGKGKKRTKYDDLVILPLEDFINIIKNDKE